MESSFAIPVNKRFSLWRTVFSHGWCSLAPYSVDKEHQALVRLLALGHGKNILVRLEEHQTHGIKVSVSSSRQLRPSEKNDILHQLKVCLRLDEDLEEFYREARRHAGFRWVFDAGAGRLLRAPTVFEDVVKMICTTNCSWALTEIMVNNLCRWFGESFDDAGYTFPSPAAIAGSTEKFLRTKIKSGYRSPYLLELSRRVAEGELDIESWRSSNLSTPELFEEVRSVKGVGPYAAGNILKLLGRYDYLGLDSWCRGKFLCIVWQMERSFFLA